MEGCVCGQDQKVRRSVSDYFSDPMGSTDAGSNRKPARTGSVYESVNTGSVPMEEKNAMGKGRRSYTQKGASSPATRLVSDWLFQDKEANDYWQKQAEDQRESARWSKEVKEEGVPVERAAIRQLATQLKDEVQRDMLAKAQGINRDLLRAAMLDINWTQLAEDLIQP
jgi:hypothetical protein